MPFPLSLLSFENEAWNLYVMRLAMLAMRVPRPPRFVPIMRASPLLVKADRSRAAGTLLITCDEAIAVITGCFSTMPEIAL